MVHTLWAAVFILGTPAVAADAPEKHPLPPDQRAAMHEQFEQAAAEASRDIEQNPDDVNAYSRRGDAEFFLGKFSEAAADYGRMVDLDPQQDASHWRRGIALYFAGKHEAAQRQFERYRAYDDRDPETHYWLFLSQAKAEGLDKARAALRRNQKLDGTGGPAGFRMLLGEITPAEFLDEIRTADLTDTQRQRQQFYANLYIGLTHLLHDKPDLARQPLRDAVTNPWARNAGYGPRYMWHVARLQYDALDMPPRPAPAP